MRDGERVPLTIPENAVVTVVNYPAGSKFAEVAWDGHKTNMFVIDLQEKAHRIDA